MNGVPMALGSMALIALSAAARKRGTPNFQGIGWRKSSEADHDHEITIPLWYKNFTATLPKNVNAIVDDPGGFDNETTIQGTLHLNGSPHHLMAMRVWSGRPEDVDYFFPDVPRKLRDLAHRGRTIREGRISKGEKAWLDLVRSDEMSVVRDPYNRLDDFYAAYGEETAFDQPLPIMGLPGQWIVLVYPFGT